MVGGAERHAHSVLVVDDCDDTREVFVAELRSAGCDVRDAWSGADGLRQLREGYRPCVALIDVHMPGMDGWMMSERLRRDADATIANTAVVFVSGDPEEEARARAAGIREFVPKPPGRGALIAAVERYCGQYSV